MDGKPIQFRRLVEIFGFLGVIASLVFAALEIRQNTRAVYGATIQGMAEQSFETSMVIVQTPDLRTA